MNVKRNNILCGFFLIYFIISIINAYFMLYIPLYYFNVLDINRTELAFIQLLTYFTLFIYPFLGFFYDRYIKKEFQAKILLFISFIPFCGSFMIFICFKETLALYGVFVFLFLISSALIRTGMTGLYLDYVKGANNSIESNNRKLQIIFTVNSASAIGFLLISFLFNFLVSDIISLTFWNNFFILGWLCSILIIFFMFIFLKKFQFLKIKEENEKKSLRKKPTIPIKEFFIMFMIFIAIFLGYSDSLYLYPKSSWIYEKFTETGFRLYSSLYFLFNFCTLFGYNLTYIIGKRANEKKILFIFIILYTPFMFLITVSNFPAFMILNGILCILGSIINLTYISYVTDFSVKTKYRTFTYLLLQTPPFLASIIFVPIGTQLSTVIKFENLVILSCFLFVISGILLFISLILKDKKPMDMLEYSIDELEQSKIA